MSNPSRTFFDRLSRDYESFIRQLVPRYDDLLETVLAAVCDERPRFVLEIGPGTGTAAASLLQRLPDTRLTAVEDSREMADRAGLTLLEHGARARVMHADIRAYAPDEIMDVILASLVLHNLKPAERRVLLKRIVTWLRPGGLFVWAEFLRFKDPVTQGAVVAARERFAREAGCPEDVVTWNFRKEQEDDFPPTAGEVLETAVLVGFATADLVWAHDAFGVFSLRAPS